MPAVDWKKSLIEQMTFAWDYMFAERMAGLTDEEYLWAPVTDVWTVHPGKDGTAATVDWSSEESDPTPFTTIAWRVHHIKMFFSERWTNHFGDSDFDPMALPVASTAEHGMNELTAAYERWRDALQSMPEQKLGEPCGPAEGPFSEASFADLVLHINREFIHHAAECALVRDLYRQRDTLR